MDETKVRLMTDNVKELLRMYEEQLRLYRQLMSTSLEYLKGEKTLGRKQLIEVLEDVCGK